MGSETKESGSMSDRSTQAQTQERTSNQASTTAPGERVSRQLDGGSKQVTTVPASMQVSFTVELVNPIPGAPKA